MEYEKMAAAEELGYKINPAWWANINLFKLIFALIFLNLTWWADIHNIYLSTWVQ